MASGGSPGSSGGTGGADAVRADHRAAPPTTRVDPVATRPRPPPQKRDPGEDDRATDELDPADRFVEEDRGHPDGQDRDEELERVDPGRAEQLHAVQDDTFAKPAASVPE